MDKKRARFATKFAPAEVPMYEIPEGSRQQQIEKRFFQMSGNKSILEVYKVRMLLKSLDVPLTAEKENELLTTYNVTLNDTLSLDLFLKIYTELTTDPEELEQGGFSSEYGKLVDAFVALGGTPDLRGTVSKEKIVSVLLQDFELTLDIGKYMQILGEDVRELNFEQFCILLNEAHNKNPSRYSSFLGRRQMSGALQFFDQLDEHDGEIYIDEEDEKEHTALVKE